MIAMLVTTLAAAARAVLQPRLARVVRGGAALMVLLAALAWLALLPGTMLHAAPPVQESNAATIVVQEYKGDIVVHQVAFTPTTISGIEALHRAGVPIESTDAGLVCRIGDVGCPADDCFCKCPLGGEECFYWAYHYWDGAAWSFYEIGATQSEVRDGAVEGWSWVGDLPPVTPEVLAAEAGLEWLRARQTADGGYNGQVGDTLDVLLAVAAANNDPALWRGEDGASLLSYVALGAEEYAQVGAAQAGKLALGVAAGEADPAAFAGMNLVDTLADYYDSDSGAFGATNWDQAFAMLGWRAAGGVVPVAATDELLARQNEDGGWGYAPGEASTVDATALALEALGVSEVVITDTAVLSGVAYLDAAQGIDAGWAYAPPGDSNANSTAFAVQGLVAGGASPVSPSYTVSGTTPISYLLGLQQPSGAFVYDMAADEDDEFATRQVIPALVGRPYPYFSPAVAERETVAWVAAQQQPDGSFAGFNPGATIDAVLALAAAGHDPAGYQSGEGNTPLDYLATVAADYVENGAAATGKLLAGVVTAGGDPRDFAGLDLVAELEALYDEDSGAYGGGGVFDQAWAIIGLRAAYRPVPDAAVAHLVGLRITGSGWGFSADSADVDSTAIALQALAAVGVPRSYDDVVAGFAYLEAAQNPDAGWGYATGVPTSASSTGIAIQALVAYGEDPDALEWAKLPGENVILRTPLDTLLAMQTTDGGFPGFSGPNDTYSTYQALPAIVEVAYPVRESFMLYLPFVAR